MSLGSHKRLITILMISLALVFLALSPLLRDDNITPRFVPSTTKSFSDSVDSVSYPFLVQRPFENGKTWVSCQTGKGYQIFLFDLEKREVIGELLHANPEFTTADQSKLVCSYMQAGTDSPMQTVARLFARLTGRPVPSAGFEETIWLVDMKTKSAKKLGKIINSGQAISSPVPSPGLDRAFIQPFSLVDNEGFYYCDLPANTFTKIKLDLMPEGWWDNNSLIARTKDNDHVLFDVVRKTTAPFLSRSQEARAFKDAGITDDPDGAALFFVWNGKEYDAYLTDAQKRWLTTDSFLFKIQRPAMTLKLVSQNFQFGWLDQFNPTQTHYIYTGRNPGKGSSAVYLRDLAANTETTLVPDDGSTQFSRPRFRGNQVIFVRTNALYQVDLTGSNLIQLFPPEPK